MLPSKEHWILEDEIISYFKGDSTVSINSYSIDFEGNDIPIVEIKIFSDTESEFVLVYSEGQIRISYPGKPKDEIIVYCSAVAEGLNAMLLADINLQYPKSKILAAKKRLARKPKEPKIEFLKESFGGNNMWLAIRSGVDQVKTFFDLEGTEKPWVDGLESMYACEGMFLCEFSGWTFIAGQKTEMLFRCQIDREEAGEKFHVEKLLEWGKVFKDVQLYMHYDRSMYFNAFYRVLNGELVYGEYETESYKKKYGKMPKNLEDLPDKDANTIAIEWSYDPDYLRYQKELENIRVWVVNVNFSKHTEIHHPAEN